MKRQIFTAIIFTENGEVLKYRNIINYDHDQTKFYNTNFVAFALSKGAKTINLYHKTTKQFFEQLKFETK